jgi:hypothetical protein
LIFYIGIIEPFLNQNIIENLLPYSIKIFCTNNIHPACKPLPIGLRDGEEIFPCHINFTGKDILKEINENMIKEKEKYILCLLCFSAHTDPSRRDLEILLGEKKYVCNLNNDRSLQWKYAGGLLDTDRMPSVHCGLVPQWVFYDYCASSKYTLCPKGLGEDTHRFFEAIALKSIPIVKKTNSAFDEIFVFFPCLVINVWEECTEEYLLKNYQEKKIDMEKFHEKYPDYLININTIKDIIRDL